MKPYLRNPNSPLLLRCNCQERKCKHFIGELFDNQNDLMLDLCNAFPSGIPDEIAYGDELHIQPLAGQENNIVFEEVE